MRKKQAKMTSNSADASETSCFTVWLVLWQCGGAILQLVAAGKNLVAKQDVDNRNGNILQSTNEIA